jgi:molybdopterin molybdotransferase
MLRPAFDDCFAHDERRLTHHEALALLQSRVAPVVQTEPVALGAAAGRRIAEPVAAPVPVPAHTNAAVDGYAFAHAAYDRKTGSTFDLGGRAAAGHPLSVAVGSQAAARIFTGAVMPAGTDTVAMQEDCRIDGGRVHIPGGLRAGANVRRAGEDVATGTTLFAPGHLVRPQDLAALASIGRATVSCFRRLRVAIVASGDEIISAGSTVLAPGEVFDANTAMLHALVDLAGAQATSLGIWPDDRQLVQSRLAEAAGDFDVLLTTGGASRGEEDHMGAALAALGSRHFWQLAVKPGRPMMFGQIAGSRAPGTPACVVAGLPGNPVAVFVCFLMYVFPMLQRLGGGDWREPRRYKLPAAFDFTGRKPGRREFWRGILVDTPAGLAVDKFARDGSGLISGLRAADGLIDIPENAGDVARGDLVDFIPFSEFGIVGG